MKNIIKIEEGKFIQTVTINKKEDENMDYENNLKFLAKISCYGILGLAIVAFIYS